MSRFCYSAMFVFSLFVVSISSVGCADSGNEVIEDTRPAAEVEQELEDYDEQMSETKATTTNS